MTEYAVLQIPSRSSVAQRWGLTYRGVGELVETVSATIDALADRGVLCVLRRVADGVVEIEGETRHRWYQLLARARPQRVRGRVEWERGSPESPAGEGELRLSLDFQFLDWYRRLVLGLWSFWVVGLGALFWFTDPEQFRGGESPSAALVGGTAVVLGVAVGLPLLMRPLGGARFQAMIWQPILQAVDRAGGYLEPEGSVSGRRFGLWLITYGVSFLLFGGGGLISEALTTTRRVSPGGFWFLVVLAALAVLLLVSAVAIGVWRGFGLRVEAIVLGLGSSTAMLVLFAAPLVPALMVDASPATLQTHPDRAVSWARMVLGGTGLILLFGLAFALYMVLTSRYVWRPLERTRSLRGRPGIYRDAVGGGALLTAARGFFGLYGLVVAGIVVAIVAVSAAWAMQALGLVSFEGRLLRAPALSGPVFAIALGLPPETSWTDGVARVVWVGWSALLWAAFGLSLGELARQRWRRRRELIGRTPGSSVEHRRLVECSDRLVRRSGGPSVHMAVSSSALIGAFAQRFYWPRRGRFVEVTQGALDHLAPDQLEALVAHELVHLRRGHVLVHDLMRWLCRVAFLGDGFAQGLLDSFGWELEADRAAAAELGEGGDALVRCLWKVAAVNGREASLAAVGGLGLSPSPDTVSPEASDRAEGGEVRNLAVAWRRFVRQYTGRSALHYWHPITDERVDRIRRLGVAAGDRRGEL